MQVEPTGDRGGDIGAVPYTELKYSSIYKEMHHIYLPVSILYFILYLLCKPKKVIILNLSRLYYVLLCVV